MELSGPPKHRTVALFPKFNCLRQILEDRDDVMILSILRSLVDSFNKYLLTAHLFSLLGQEQGTKQMISCTGAEAYSLAVVETLIKKLQL